MGYLETIFVKVPTVSYKLLGVVEVDAAAVFSSLAFLSAQYLRPLVKILYALLSAIYSIASSYNSFV